MEFRHLQTFQAIAQEGGFLKAAEKLQYAQSTITLHIQQLEAELGVKLFSRRGKRTELRVAGRTLRLKNRSSLLRLFPRHSQTKPATGRSMRVLMISPMARNRR